MINLTGLTGRLRAAFLLLAFMAGPTYAQFVPSNSVPIGRGPGVNGFNSAAPGSSSNCLMSNGPNAAPSFQSCGTGGRQRLTTSLNYFVRTTGSDSNDCLSATAGGGHGPCLTVQHPIDLIHNNIDFTGQSIAIDVGPGTFIGQVANIGSFLGGSSIQINGAGSGLTTISAPTGLYAVWGHAFTGTIIGGVTFTCQSGAAGHVFSSEFAVVDTWSDVVYGSCPGAYQNTALNGGIINIIFPTTVTGGAGGFAGVNGPGSGIFINRNGPANISIPNAVAYTLPVCAASSGGVLDLTAASFIGAGAAGTTGTRYSISTGGIITSDGRSLNATCPGNVNAITTLGNTNDTASSNSLASTVDSSSYNLGALTIVGGLGVAKNLQVAGHLGSKSSALVPTLSACGTGATLISGATDTSGTIHVGTGDTGCVLTMAQNYQTAFSCLLYSTGGHSVVSSLGASPSRITITDGGGALAGDLINYICTGD